MSYFFHLLGLFGPLQPERRHFPSVWGLLSVDSAAGLLRGGISSDQCHCGRPKTVVARHIDGIATTALYDSGAEIQLISKEFCEENILKIHPIEKLTECSTMNGDIFGYEGFIEVNVQIPGRDFSEDHLFLVTSEISN